MRLILEVLRYVADLESYLSAARALCINEEIIVQLLWAGYLILLSGIFYVLQIQHHGLNKAIWLQQSHDCKRNQTETIVFGNLKESKLQFNSVDIEDVNYC